MAWECNKCGACCRIAGKIVPELDRGDGVCRWLTETNLCSIYEIRPQICRTKNFPATNMEREKACNFLREYVYGTKTS